MRRRTQALLLGGAAIDALFPLTVMVLDVVNLDVHPMSSTLSRHALRPGFPWMSAAFLVHATALGLLAWGLHLLPPRPWAAPTALILAAIASALLSYFAADAPDHETSFGHLHEAIAPVAFLGITAGSLFAVHAQRSHPAWSGLWQTPRLFAFALLASLAAFGAVLLAAQFHDPLHAIYGVAERFVVVAIGGWMVSTAVQGARATARRPRAQTSKRAARMDGR